MVELEDSGMNRGLNWKTAKLEADLRGVGRKEEVHNKVGLLLNVKYCTSHYTAVFHHVPFVTRFCINSFVVRVLSKFRVLYE